MRKFLGILSACIAAGICIWIAIRFFPNRESHGLIPHVLAAVVVMGLTSFSGSILSHIRPQQKWAYLNWISTGGLFAIVCVGVLNIAPYVFDALVFAFLGAVLLTRWGWRNAIINFGLVGSSALVVFILLLAFVVSVDVDMVDTPEGSSVLTSLPQVDYVDAFQIEVPANLQFNIDTLIVLTNLSLRPTYGDVPKFEEYWGRNVDEDARIEHWSIYYKDSCEAHIGFQRSFIDFKVSIFQQKRADRTIVTLTTVAQFKNVWGTLYFIPIRFGHQIYLADTARKLRAYLMDLG
jgi:hypothetical protein